MLIHEKELTLFLLVLWLLPRRCLSLAGPVGIAGDPGIGRRPRKKIKNLIHPFERSIQLYYKTFQSGKLANEKGRLKRTIGLDEPKEERNPLSDYIILGKTKSERLSSY